MKRKADKSAVLMLSNGMQREVKPSGKKFTLAELQGHVGGYIQLRRLDFGAVLVMNEDGKMMDMDLNMAATYLARIYGAIAGNDYIVGPVLMCHESMLG